jgi:hypothetical protein
VTAEFCLRVGRRLATPRAEMTPSLRAC